MVDWTTDTRGTPSNVTHDQKCLKACLGQTCRHFLQVEECHSSTWRKCSVPISRNDAVRRCVIWGRNRSVRCCGVHWRMPRMCKRMFDSIVCSNRRSIRVALPRSVLKGGVFLHKFLETPINWRRYLLSDMIRPPTTLQMLLLFHALCYFEFRLPKNTLHVNWNTNFTSRMGFLVQTVVKARGVLIASIWTFSFPMLCCPACSSVWGREILLDHIPFW